MRIKTAVFLAADRFGCGHYRMFLPSVALCRQGIPAHLVTTDRIHLYSLADTLVVQRPADQSLELVVEEVQERGGKVVYELDDNIWDLPKYNLAYPFWTKMRLETTTRILKKCNRVVTTTEYLANVMRQYHDDVWVVPNAVFDHHYLDLPRQLRYNSKIVIAWIGSSFHRKDNEIFKSLIPIILDKYKDVGFVFMGEPPSRELQLYGNRIVAFPFVEPIYYHQVLSSFKMDIGLAPLTDCEFNKCKSPIKLVEYLYSETFPICSDLEPYSVISKEKENICKLVPTSPDNAGKLDDWIDIIEDCIANINTYNEYAQEGKKFVLENYNVECPKMIELYKQVYFMTEDA